MIGHRIVWVSLFANVTLAIALLKFEYPNSFQSIADTLFNSVTTDPTLRGWELIGFLYGMAALLAAVATRSIGRAAVAELAETG